MWLMGRSAALLLYVCLLSLRAQSPDDPEVLQARARLEKLRVQAAAGAVPRKQLEKAEEQMADAQDAALLRKTIYAQDLTAEQADEMIAAAGRRLARREKAFDEARALVDSGIAPEVSLSTSMDELRMAKKEYDLAESRAALVRQLAEMARAEELMARPEHAAPDAHSTEALAERFDGDGTLAPGAFEKIDQA